MNFKPMLSADASTLDLHTLKFPLLVSPKLDGLRCILWEGVAYSRNGKPFRNRYVQKWAKENNLHDIDGEIVVGSPTDPLCLLNSKAVTAYDGEPDFTFFAFDIPTREMKFDDVEWELEKEWNGTDRITVLTHDLVHDVAEMEMIESRFLDAGYEGIMIRSIHGPYKFGRATVKEGHLLKLKRFMDGEATVISIEEAMTNENTLEKDELGRAKRSKARGGLVPAGMLGTIIAHDEKWGELRIAPGTMKHDERRHHWSSGGKDIIGQVIHWRSFGYGVKDKPRFARYYGMVEES